MSSPPVLVWTSWSPTNSTSKSAPTGGVIFGPCLSFQIWNAGRDARGFNAVISGCEVVLNKVDFSLDNGKLVAEVAELVVGALISLNFSGCILIVEISDGTMEGVIRGSGAVEEGVEPDREWLGDVVQ
jgi:hypothetical protein